MLRTSFGSRLVSLRYFATCARGLEPLLADELADLGGRQVEPGRGGVEFRGDLALLYRANLGVRTAVRILRPILSATTRTPDELYDAVRSVDWSAYMTPDHTLAVDCNVRDSQITHSLYASRRVKDAICDQFRERCGRRPSVDAERPMVGFNLHIYRNEAVLSLDSSGESLHKRGYRPVQTRAPLNEALAAALILRTGYHGERAFADPLCGGGTLCIEAAWIALRRAPGLTRKHFGFMGWPDYNVRLFAEVRDELRSRSRRDVEFPIVGADQRADAIEFATGNARNAGVGHIIDWQVSQLHDWQPPAGPGVVICNPPYGERIGDVKELMGYYRQMGQVFRERCAGWDCWVFTSNDQLAEAVDIEPAGSIPYFNGKIPCRLWHYLP
ncbi:MAG: RNA methyltransferase [Gemmataceae bacterium]|nr:RNA methyltransferase [Gemmataceae bacterium]